jgi:hypothetical protein
MAKENDFVILVTKLIELTQEKKIAWEKLDPPSEITSSFERVKVVYRCEYKDIKFRLYEKNSKNYEEDFDSRYFWDTDIVLEIVDENDYVMHIIPKNIALKDLIFAVKNQDLNIDDVISKIIKN